MAKKYNILLVFTFILLQGLFFYWLSFIPVPSWQTPYQLIGALAILLGLFLAVYLLFRFWQQARKKYLILWAIAYSGISVIIIIYFSSLAFFLNLSQVAGFLCSLDEINPVHFPQYGTTIYLIDLSCIPDGHGSVYVQNGWLPVMQHLGSFHSRFYDPIAQLERNDQIVKISGSNQVIYYNLKSKESWNRY